MTDKYRDTFDTLVNMAKVKMSMNSHKGNIEDCDPDSIIIMMKKEVDELTQAINDGDILGTIEEAADVMNFLVALVHQRITAYRSRK